MARSLGIPARVAVGFTPGEVAGDERTYTVRGRNAHAWPEVFIPGAGWVGFEPTPGRGQPGAEEYTGVDPQQAEATPIPTSTTTTLATTTTGPAGPTPEADEPPVRAGAAPVTAEPDEERSPIVTGLSIALVVAAAVVVADVVLLAAIRVVRRRRRRSGRTVSSRVRAAWADAIEAVARTGPRPRAAETPTEYARRASPVLGPDADALARLAALTTAATWAPDHGAAQAEAAADADALAARVARRVRSQLTWGQRVRAAVDPRLHLWGWDRP